MGNEHLSRDKQGRPLRAQVVRGEFGKLVDGF